MKLPQNARLGSEICEIGPKVATWGIRWTGFPPEDSPLFYKATNWAGNSWSLNFLRDSSVLSCCPYGPEELQKIHKEFAFIGAFKLPCTLP